MNNKFFLILIFLIPSFLYAHTLLLDVHNNDDNTITVEGSFSTGEGAVGAQIRLESLITEKILYKKRLPNESELTINIPKEPYKVILDGGPGHTIEKEGFAPIEGFSKELLEKKKVETIKQNRGFERGTTTKILIGGVLIAFLLILLTIFISIRNTNKIIAQLKTKG